jgi:hypothetical protein
MFRNFGTYVSNLPVLAYCTLISRNLSVGGAEKSRENVRIIGVPTITGHLLNIVQTSYYQPVWYLSTINRAILLHGIRVTSGCDVERK